MLTHAILTASAGREGPRVLAGLIRRFGDFELAEDALQDAFAKALAHWPREGLPDNPGGVADDGRPPACDRPAASARVGPDLHRRPARSRRPRSRRRREDPAASSGLDDDRLRLRLHLLPPGDRATGPGGAGAAHAVRAVDARDRARLPRTRSDDGAAAGPRQAQDPRRRHPVRGAGPRRCCPNGCRPCSASSTSSSTRATRAPSTTGWSRPDLCAEAIRLARLLVELMPDEPEVRGLLALVLLHDARRAGARRRCGRAGAARGAGPQPLAAGHHRRRPRASSTPRWRSGGADPTSCRPRSQPCTRARGGPRTPTGSRSPRCTVDCSPNNPARSSS